MIMDIKKNKKLFLAVIIFAIILTIVIGYFVFNFVQISLNKKSAEEASSGLNESSTMDSRIVIGMMNDDLSKSIKKYINKKEDKVVAEVSPVGVLGMINTGITKKLKIKESSIIDLVTTAYNKEAIYKEIKYNAYSAQYAKKNNLYPSEQEVDYEYDKLQMAQQYKYFYVDMRGLTKISEKEFEVYQKKYAIPNFIMQDRAPKINKDKIMASLKLKILDKSISKTIDEHEKKMDALIEKYE